MSNPFETDLDQNKANYTPLSPLSFTARAAYVYPNKTSVVHGDRRYTWAQTFSRCRQLASALAQQGLGIGDTVSVMGFNTPETYEAHFGVPMMGGVLHAINTRLDAKNIAFMMGHAETKVLITDRAASAVIREALDLAENKPLVIDIDDKTVSGGDLLGEMDYEAFIGTGDPNFEWQLPVDEWQAISLNYTSGTTGNPKGVVYHHRGAYLNATSNIVGWELPKHPTYLWTLPMFHCNGWCFPWTMAAVGGTNVCLRDVRVEKIYDLIESEGITHYCGAPIVHQMIAMAPAELKAKKTNLIKGMVAGAPPPAAVLAAMAESGFQVTHVYGLTETYGPAVICDWDPDWNEKSVADQAEINARQGVKYHMLEDLIVANPETLELVPADGQTMGEVMFR
ncbi:MAG: AMP-binding protein, partial [Chloroflexota bacterium]